MICPLFSTTVKSRTFSQISPMVRGSSKPSRAYPATSAWIAGASGTVAFLTRILARRGISALRRRPRRRLRHSLLLLRDDQRFVQDLDSRVHLRFRQDER